MTVGQQRRKVGQVVAKTCLHMFGIGGNADRKAGRDLVGNRRLQVDRAEAGLVRGITRPAVGVVIGGEAERRCHGKAQRQTRRDRISDRAGWQGAVIDRVVRIRIAADRRGRLSGAHDQRTIVMHVTARHDLAHAERSVAAGHPAGGGRVPPQRRRALIGDLAREGASSATHRLLLQVKRRRIGGRRDAAREDGNRGREKRALGNLGHPELPRLFVGHWDAPHRTRVQVWVLHNGHMMQPRTLR